MTQSNIARISAQLHDVIKALNEELINIASIDSGVRSQRTNEEPGQSIKQDLEFTLQGRLDFLSRNLSFRKNFYDSSSEQLAKAEAAYRASIDNREGGIDDPAAPGQGSEVAQLDMDVYVAERYQTVNEARYLPMAAEYNALLEAYEEVFGKKYDPTVNTTDNRRARGVTVDADVMKKAMAARAAAAPAKVANG